MKRAFRELRDTYGRISKDITEDTPLPIFTDGIFLRIILMLAVIALCLSISTGIMYLGAQAMSTQVPLVLYPLALILHALYTVGGMALLAVLGMGGLLLTFYGMYWMVMVPLIVGVWLWSLVPSNNKHVRRK
jgi:hypothetical protein